MRVVEAELIGEAGRVGVLDSETGLRMFSVSYWNSVLRNVHNDST